MIIHSWGQTVTTHDSDGFHIYDRDATVRLKNGKCILEPGNSNNIFDLNANFLATRLDTDETEILGEDLTWIFPGTIRSHCNNHFFGITWQVGEEKEYVAMTMAGDELFKLPYRPDEVFCEENNIIAGHNDQWKIYSLDGQMIYSCEGRVHWQHYPLGRICSKACFFESPKQDGSYQVFDLIRQKPAAQIKVDGTILGVLPIRENRIIVVDHSGLFAISINDAGISMGEKHNFQIQTDLNIAEFNPRGAKIWSDGVYAYIATESPFNDGVHLLVSASLEDGKPIQQISWENEWAVIGNAGFICNHNHLQLRRRQVMSDGGVMIWPAGALLSEDLFKEVLSPNLEATEIPSETKGKKTFHIKIHDRSVNNAVRSAASVICRHLGESCKGPYNLSESVSNRKFDGQFHVEIWSPQEPNEFEREYLVKLVEFQRYYGGLSPAGSRSGLKIPKIEFHLES